MNFFTPVLASTLLLCFFLVAVIQVRKNDESRFSQSVLWLTAGVFLADVILFIPVCSSSIPYGVSWLKLIFMSTVNALQMFVLNVGFDAVISYTQGMKENMRSFYMALSCLLFVLSPVLTFSVVLSSLENAYLRIKILLCRRKDIYLFSQMNPINCNMAEYIASSKDAIVIVSDREKRESGYLSKKKVITTNHSLPDIKLDAISKKSEKYFVINGEKESDNISQLVYLLKKYQYDRKTNIYLFSDSLQSELFFRELKTEGPKVRRINLTQSVVYDFLYNHGYEMYESAIRGTEGEKNIKVLIVGFTNEGKELLKALSWYCQMDGYKLSVIAVSVNENALSNFQAECPELMLGEHNGKDVKGDAFYKIEILHTPDYTGIEFEDLVIEAGQESCVFVNTGDDETNLGIALRLRVQFERMKQTPVIYIKINDSENIKKLSEVTDYKGHPYDFRFWGVDTTLLSCFGFLPNEYENKALERHMLYYDEESFWQYEYNYRSSVASVIHLKAVAEELYHRDGKYAGVNEKNIGMLQELEHKRWNAFMRSEGYIFSGSLSPETRNDMAKMHNLMVPYSILPNLEQNKDMAGKLISDFLNEIKMK